MPSNSVAARAALRLLTDECQLIGAQTGGTLNESSLAFEPDSVTVDWAGPCSTFFRASSRVTTEKAAQLEIDELGLRLPMSAPVCQPGTIVRFTKAADSEMVGDDYEVVRTVTRSHQTLRRVVLRRRVMHATVATVAPVVP